MQILEGVRNHIKHLKLILAPIRMVPESLKQLHIMVLPISEICCPSGNFTVLIGAAN
jgi:hypothetical protein